MLVALSFNSSWREMGGSLGGSICEVSTERPNQPPEQRMLQRSAACNQLQACNSQAISISLSAGSSTSYVSNSGIGDRFSVPGNANCFLPGVDEFVPDESVWGVAFRLPVQISYA